MAFTELLLTIAGQPLLDVILFLKALLWHNSGMALASLTVIYQACLMPFTIRVWQQSLLEHRLRPQIKAIEKKFSTDRRSAARESVRLRRENGITFWTNFLTGILLTIVSVPPSGVLCLWRADPASNSSLEVLTLRGQGAFQ